MHNIYHTPLPRVDTVAILGDPGLADEGGCGSPVLGHLWGDVVCLPASNCCLTHVTTLHAKSHSVHHLCVLLAEGCDGDVAAGCVLAVLAALGKLFSQPMSHDIKRSQ